MKTARYYSRYDIRLEEMPVPEIETGELLMKIEACGICGSDVMEWYRIHKAPLVLGHEVAGTVEEMGQGIEQYKKGDRISASHHVPCNTCRYCRAGRHTVCDTLRSTNFDPGGFAEYVRLPAINVDRGVYPIPDGVSLGRSWEIAPKQDATRSLPLVPSLARVVQYIRAFLYLGDITRARPFSCHLGAPSEFTTRTTVNPNPI